MKKQASPARSYWKAWWRLIRVTQREQRKASLDLMLYGAGAVWVPFDGSDPRHVPIGEFRHV